MTTFKEPDFGTPASPSDVAVTLTVDGRRVTVPAGTSILRAATEAGGSIPKLCATDLVKAYGSCRLCLVEVEGRRARRPPAPRRWPREWSFTPIPTACCGYGAT